MSQSGERPGVRMTIPEAVKQLLEIVRLLQEAYPAKRFTLDGRLVGDIGEVLAEESYDLQLSTGLQKHHDAVTADGRHVQIKATMQGGLTFPVDHVPDYYLGILIHVDGNLIDRPTRDVGIVYQHYSLYDFLTAQVNTAFGLMLDQTSLPFRCFQFWKWRRLRKQHMKQAAALLIKVGLGDAVLLRRGVAGCAHRLGVLELAGRVFPGDLQAHQPNPPRFAQPQAVRLDIPVDQRRVLGVQVR